MRPSLEVADIFRRHGEAWRKTQHGHLSLGQLKVMSAIERCRSAELGGHVLHCRACGSDEVAYNSCRNRHCPKCQGNAARRWLKARQSDLLPVEYYHVVFTLPAPIAAIAYYNKAVVYKLLFDVAAETMRTIAADPKHLGAHIGATLVLHTWGSAMTHHPHVHGIVPGGGLSLDGKLWVACKPGFFLHVKVLSRLFRRRFLEELGNAYRAGQLQFFGDYAKLNNHQAFARWLAPLKRCEWVVYAKKPFAGPAAVLAYLSRYTHRVAISNQRLIASNENGVTFRYKDYRAKGRTRHKTMTLSQDEFMRRFLLHVLPSGFHRIRHYGLLANSGRKDNLEKARELLQVTTTVNEPNGKIATIEPAQSTFTCSDCGAAMVIVSFFTRETLIRAAMCSVNDKSLRFLKHRAPNNRSAPIGNAIAAACKTRVFHSVVWPNRPIDKGISRITDNPKPNLFKQTGLIAANIGRPTIQMPIARRTP